MHCTLLHSLCIPFAVKFFRRSQSYAILSKTDEERQWRYVFFVEPLFLGFSSLGEHTDHCSEWTQKTEEVRTFLFKHLPLEKAAQLNELYLSHVKARIGKGLKTREEKVYRKLLEFEETLLLWEELRV